MIPTKFMLILVDTNFTDIIYMNSIYVMFVEHILCLSIYCLSYCIYYGVSYDVSYGVSCCASCCVSYCTSQFTNTLIININKINAKL